MQLTDYLDAATAAARRGAAVLAEYRKKFHVREKARFDLVTEADLKSQEAIYSELHGRFPDHAFLGEEDTTTLASMANLALAYWNQGRWNEARKVLVQVTETRKI